MSKRIKRVNQLIKQEISQILLREIDSLKDTLVTVTRAETTPDLRESKIFLSVIPEENTNKIIKFLNRKLKPKGIFISPPAKSFLPRNP